MKKLKLKLNVEKLRDVPAVKTKEVKGGGDCTNGLSGCPRNTW